MRKKVVGIFVCMLLTTTILPMTAVAADPENPEVVDRIMDVKLFGIFPFLGQNNLKYADIVSAWFHEDSGNPDYLYIILKVRGLREKTDKLEAIYDVGWTFNYNTYATCAHANPGGFGAFQVGKSIDGDDNFESWYSCDGSFNLENNTITWIVPKEIIGNPHMGNTIISIFPSTHLRFTDDSGLPRMDLFKDLSYNAKTRKDYTIQY